MPEDEMPAARRLLENLGVENAAPVWSLDDPPLDDEPLAPEDEAALAEAEEM